MKKNQYFPMTLIAVAILSGCNSVPPKNSSLEEAHGSYDSARNDLQVTNLAALELKEAGDSLSKADIALSKGESDATVNQLAYIARQQVGIAQETTKRKTSELAVANAGAKRDKIRLEARTAEADAAKQQTVTVQETANRQAAALTDARANAERDQASIKAATAETDAAKQQAATMQETANRQAAALTDARANAESDQISIRAAKAQADAAEQQVAFVSEIADAQAAALANADANAASNQASLAAKTAEADEARKQVMIAQDTANQQATALAVASANAASDQKLIAKQEMQLKELDAKKTKRGLVITLGDVLFSTNKAQLESGGVRNVQKLADFLKQYPQQKVLVEGYTDSTGGSSLNQELSERRASAVRAALLDKGISSDRVTTHGYGEKFPVAGNDTAASRQLNRRVEVIFSDDNGNIAPR